MEYKHWVKAGGHVAFVQMEHNTIFPGRRMKDGGMRITALPDGIYVNGDYGINPSREEMREMVEVMRECVAEFDRLQNEVEHETSR